MYLGAVLGVELGGEVLQVREGRSLGELLIAHGQVADVLVDEVTRRRDR